MHFKDTGIKLNAEYKEECIKTIILRIDYGDTPLDLEKALPVSLTKKVLAEFPISEPISIIIKDQTNKVTRSTNKNLMYHGKLRDKSLTISFDNTNIVYKRYEPIESIVATFSSLLEEIFAINPDLQVNRFGLRYVHQIEPKDTTNPFDWNGLIDSRLEASLNFIPDGSSILRAFNLLELDYSDMRILFQYGMHNPDHPSPIKKKIFTLDYDASFNGLQTKDDIKSNITNFYNKINELFKASVGPDLEK